MSKRRRMKALHRACVAYGEANLRKLKGYHIGGVTAVLCRNCFRRLKRTHSTKPRPMSIPPDKLEVVTDALLAEVDLLVTVAESRMRFAQALINRMQREALDPSPDK
ncbi:MAG: hypothetical protein KGJ66_09515 [Alphaproteobacteria bacterium]|nr:hypothetical protein [Alphaproteobacteria bacterium]